MAHGIGGTRDSGLLPFAEAFAEAGLDALVFDYRNFGDSTGEPRQLAWPPRHREDYRMAVTYARSLEGVDPDRIVLWGTSWSAGHAVYIAAEDPRIAAVICQTPDLDGARTMMQIGRYAGPLQQLRVTLVGVRDAVQMLRGLEPTMIPTVGRPGELAALSSEESEPGYLAIAGPTWRNEITGRAAFGEWTNRAITLMDKVRCPILVQIADRDSIAPPHAARAAAWKGKRHVQVHEYPIAHFDVYVGEGRERASADQIRFLTRVLRAPDSYSGNGANPARRRTRSAG